MLTGCPSQNQPWRALAAHRLKQQSSPASLSWYTDITQQSLAASTAVSCSRWLTAKQIYASVAATQQAQSQMPETKADPKAISPHSSTHFEQSVQSQKRRHHAPAGCSEKRVPAARASPDLPLLDYFSNTPPQRDLPANKDSSSIKWTSKSMTDGRQVSSSAEEKPQKNKQHYLGRLLTGNAADVSAAQSGLTTQSDAAAFSQANELERLIKDLETQTYEVALLLSRGTDKKQKRHLHLKLYNLEKNIREKQELLRKYKIKTHPAKVPEADPLSPGPDNPTLLAQKLQTLPLREQPLQGGV
ncbi:hypothetical protein LA080_009517 [Diaporthe eres]|nr:hypothetical protein LA080_009517 [Diaporthe eres]